MNAILFFLPCLALVVLYSLPNWEGYSEHEQDHCLDQTNYLFPEALRIEVEVEWMEYHTKNPDQL